MKTYELTYIISPNLSSEKINSETKEIESFIQSKEGVFLGSNLFGQENKIIAQTLAYPIKKQRSGYFITLTFQILEDKVKELKEKLEKNTDILRHFIIIKKPVKELKKRRTKKLSTTFQSEVIGKSSVFKHDDKRESEKVDLDKIDRKLDEILSE